MKALPLILAALFVAGCDMKKVTGTGGSASSESASDSGGGSDSPSQTKPAPPKATPKPTPKPGDWMLKNYKNPLEQKPK